MRSIGERTQSPAKATASFADRGTRGSRRSRRTVVTHAGRTVAKSLAEPGGNRLASTIISSHEQSSTMKPITNHFSTQRNLSTVVAPVDAGTADLREGIDT